MSRYLLNFNAALPQEGRCSSAAFIDRGRSAHWRASVFASTTSSLREKSAQHPARISLNKRSQGLLGLFDNPVEVRLVRCAHTAKRSIKAISRVRPSMVPPVHSRSAARSWSGSCLDPDWRCARCRLRRSILSESPMFISASFSRDQDSNRVAAHPTVSVRRILIGHR